MEPKAALLLVAVAALLLAGCSGVDEELLQGVWQRTENSQTTKGKEYLSDNTGFLGNFNSGSWARATTFTWEVDGDVLTEQRQSGTTFNEEVVTLEEDAMVQRREEDGKERSWKKR